MATELYSLLNLAYSKILDLDDKSKILFHRFTGTFTPSFTESRPSGHTEVDGYGTSCKVYGNVMTLYTRSRKSSNYSTGDITNEPFNNIEFTTTGFNSYSDSEELLEIKNWRCPSGGAGGIKSFASTTTGTTLNTITLQFKTNAVVTADVAAAVSGITQVQYHNVI